MNHYPIWYCSGPELAAMENIWFRDVWLRFFGFHRTPSLLVASIGVVPGVVDQKRLHAHTIPTQQ